MEQHVMPETFTEGQRAIIKLLIEDTVKEAKKEFSAEVSAQIRTHAQTCPVKGNLKTLIAALIGSGILGAGTFKVLSQLIGAE